MLSCSQSVSQKFFRSIKPKSYTKLSAMKKMTSRQGHMIEGKKKKKEKDVARTRRFKEIEQGASRKLKDSIGKALLHPERS